jgi:hypothetical protein
VTPTIRTKEQTQIGIYWAYDGTPSLCALPRLYNKIAVHIADQMGTSLNTIEFVRLLALENVAMADAAIAVWESKYCYNYWRPVTGIREFDDGTDPTGAGDGNIEAIRDPTYSLLAARRAGKQTHGAELHTTLPFLPIRTPRVRRCPFLDLAQLLQDQ